MFILSAELDSIAFGSGELMSVKNMIMLGKFQLGNTIGTASQIQGDAMAPFSAIVDGTKVHVQLLPQSSATSEDLAAWVVGFDLTIELSELDEASQRQTYGIMITAASRISDHIRILQPTSGLAGTRPETNWINIVVDGQTRSLCFDWHSHYRESVTLFYHESFQPSRKSMLRALEDDSSPDKDLDIYLAQARHFATFNPDSNPSLAVYLAALACELKIKRALRRCTAVERLPELEDIIPASSPAKKQIPSLYSSVSKNFMGRSLKEDNKLLLRRVNQLFDLRNSFTHKAVEIPLATACECTSTARRAVLWVEEIELALSSISHVPSDSVAERPRHGRT